MHGRVQIEIARTVFVVQLPTYIFVRHESAPASLLVGCMSVRVEVNVIPYYSAIITGQIDVM